MAEKKKKSNGLRDFNLIVKGDSTTFSLIFFFAYFLLAE